MTHERVDDEIRATAALYALGALPAEPARIFERHLAEHCAVCEVEAIAFGAVAGNLALAALPVEPRPDVRARLLAEIRATDPPGFEFIRAGEGAWTEVQPGVVRKDLGAPTATSTSYLVRMRPGATVHAHRHAAIEHCYVVEGDLLVAGRRLAAGDYHRAAAASTHENLRTDGGCLLLIVEARA